MSVEENRNGGCCCNSEVLNNIQNNVDSCGCNMERNDDNCCERMRTRKEMMEKIKCLDFAIIEGQFPKETSINSFLLAEDEMILVTSPSHTFKNMKKINRLLLQKERLILRERKSNTRTLIEEFLNNNGDSISRYNVMLELENINLIKELVSQNYGVSILPRSVCQQEIKKGKLIEVELEDFHIHRGIYIVYKNKCAYLNICQEIENVIASKKSFE